MLWETKTNIINNNDNLTSHLGPQHMLLVILQYHVHKDSIVQLYLKLLFSKYYKQELQLALIHY